jgi:hypothetical protein
MSALPRSRQPRIMPMQIGEHWPTFRSPSAVDERFGDYAII